MELLARRSGGLPAKTNKSLQLSTTVSPAKTITALTPPTSWFCCCYISFSQLICHPRRRIDPSTQATTHEVLIASTSQAVLSPETGRTFSPDASPRTSYDVRRSFSPAFHNNSQQSPPPLQHPQPQRAWSGDGIQSPLGGVSSSNSNGGGGGYHVPSRLGGVGGGMGDYFNALGAREGMVSEFDTSLGMRLDYEACLAYLALPPLGAILLLILERKSDYVRFHAWQSSLLFTALFVAHLLFSWSTFLSWVIFLGDLVLIGWLVVNAYRDADTLDRYEVPIVGRIASRILDDE
ncbi:hypothetical protein B0T17DRAFT_613232 [Bombardia bombarda]|uniref:Uncharacterized protein n=1 Tax=Bombardia bombarda TaxID=252184 RepID=A0AA39XM06_9PEZI|nr:hypothetical protein B0T17DRAFT_613232 [Bombardia bombarda]